MSIEIQCLNCAAKLKYNPSTVGKKVKCPVCSQTFSVPPLASKHIAVEPHQTPHAHEPASQPDPSFLDRRNFQSAYSRSRRDIGATNADTFIEFIVYLFDPTFSKYVTPWIIRVTWVIVLVLASYSLVLYTFGGLWESLGLNYSPPRGIVSPNRKTEEIVQLIFRWLLRGSTAVLALMWTRVWLETCIVIFDISNTLKQMARDG